jgi:phage terminase large subunit-like protein
MTNDSKLSNSKMILPSTPAERRLLASHSPLFFDVYYCGMQYAKHRAEWLKRLDDERKQAIQERRKNRILLLAPRSHGKTELAVTYALRAICLNRDVRILWICASAPQAERRMSRVKELLKSEKIIEDWASDIEAGCLPFEGGGESWTQRQIYVKRKNHSVDPTIQAIGSGGAITGAHFDIILADDLEDDDTVYSLTSREKTRRWFRGTVQPMLEPGGLMIVIGTRKHHDDLYGHLKVDPTWSVLENPAIIKWPESYEYETKEINGKSRITGVKVVGNPIVLWQEHRPFEMLMEERMTIGSQMFAREFLNQVQDDSASAFKWEWLQHAQERGRNLSFYEIPQHINAEHFDIVQGWDFSLVQNAQHAESKDSDFTVGTTWARDRRTGDHYLLGLFRKRGMSTSELKNAVVREYERFRGKVYAVAVERNAFGELHYVGLKQSTDLPLRPHLTTGAKKASPWDGVTSLSVLFENGKVIIPSRSAMDKEISDPLIQELWGLGREKHDDTVMSLWIAHCVLREERFQHVISFGDREYIDDLDNTVNGLNDQENKDLHEILTSWDFINDFDDEK